MFESYLYVVWNDLQIHSKELPFCAPEINSILKLSESVSNVITRFNFQSTNAYAWCCYLSFYSVEYRYTSDAATAAVVAFTAAAPQTRDVRGVEGKRKVNSRWKALNPRAYLLLWSQIITSARKAANRFD